MAYNRKKIPESVLVFGAAGRIGGPLARFVAHEAPDVRLRLATHGADKVAALQSAFPAAEVVVADYGDLPSLKAAVDGMEGVFAVAPSGTGERVATGNMIAALQGSPALVHFIRLVGLTPGANPHRIPARLRAMSSLPVEHALAKSMLDESGLPVTYLNCGATFMDNFILFGMTEGLRRDRTLIWPERLIPWLDTRDLGECGARLLLSDNHRHIGQFHTLNNGQDILRFQQVASLMSELWGEPIGYDGTRESFFARYAHIGPRLEILWEFFQYEQDNEVAWARNDCLEQILGRKPTSLREWLIEHRDVLLGN